jgi:hypothetical protein
MVPAIAPVLAVWPCAERAQSAKTEILNNVRVARIEILHITPFLHDTAETLYARPLTQPNSRQIQAVGLFAVAAALRRQLAR